MFDINREAEIEPILKSNPAAVLEALRADPNPNFTLSVVTNRDANLETRVLDFMGLVSGGGVESALPQD